MMKYVVTKHCSEERMERLIQIGTTIGFGEKVLIELYNEETGHLERLMDNGLLLILDAKGEVLITAFPVDVDRAFAMYKAQDKEFPRTVAKIFMNKVYKRFLSNLK